MLLLLTVVLVGSVVDVHVHTAVLSRCRISLQLFESFLFLFLLQCRDDAVYGSVALSLRHTCEFLQRVLQVYRLGEGHQFVEHLRALRQLFVVFAVFVQHADGTSVASFGVAIFLLCPVQVAQMQ